MIKIDFPQVDIPQDFIVGTNITEDVLNFYRQSCRLRAGIFALCLEGNVEVSINLTNYNLKKKRFYKSITRKYYPISRTEKQCSS